MEILIILALAFIFWPRSSKKKSTSSSGGPIVTRGSRSPMYYEIMEESHAELKEKLIRDAANGVIYRQRKSINFKEWMENKKPLEYEDYPATEALKEFLEYEKNGYM